MARPRLDEEERRARTVGVRVTPRGPAPGSRRTQAFGDLNIDPGALGVEAHLEGLLEGLREAITVRSAAS